MSEEKAAPVAPTKKSLVTKLAEVMGEVERVKKTGRNNFHGYDYATEADIVASVRAGMAARGLMLVPSIEKCEWTDRVTPKQTLKIATITVRFTFMDGESGEKIEFIGMGQGEDASDKAIYKAMTGAEKYALLKTFLIPTGDDPEADPPAAKPTSSAPAQSRTAQLKDKLRNPVMDVLPGETEEQARARLGRNAPLTVFERCCIVCTEYGFGNADRQRAIIKGATGKTTPAQLTADDIAKVRDALEALKKAEARQPNGSATQ